MSFVYPEKKGEVYAPGWFLANNEECVRLTREFAQDSQSVKTVGTAKYVPMGTVYPTNNNKAEGIVYEDVDVTAGNMPGSVVLSGTVYENRLPEAVDTYSSATVPTGGNPKELGLYERSGTSPNYVYTLTTDTAAAGGKTYYSYGGKKIASAAKTALEAKGFVFLTESEVTRPY